IFEKSPERLRLGVEATDPTWLFVLREFWIHRKVLVDGQPAETAPAQLAFTAVWLPAGSHAVEWEEMIPGAGLSRFGPVVFGLALLGISIHLRSLRRGGAPRG